MSIRKEAMTNSAFLQMKEVYDNRESIIKECKRHGKKVIGTLGYDVPDELILAADMMQYRIYGQPDIDFTETNKYLEFSFPPVVRAQFEKIIDGTDADIMDYLVISNSTDALVRIYYYIREVKSLEPEKLIPELYFIDWHFTRFRMHQIRNEQTLRNFKEQLEIWRGKKITDNEIEAASIVCNERRALLEELSELRKEGRISGTEALIIIGASYYMDVENYVVLLKGLLEDIAKWQKAEGYKVFMTGSVHENTDFYSLLESKGFNVVSEDHDWGDRSWERQTNLRIEPIKAIVDRYMLRSPGCKRAFVSERVETVCKKAVDCGAKGVISYTHAYDDAPSWDFPKQKKALAELGISSLQLSGMQYKSELDGKLETKLDEFLYTIKEI